MSVTTVRVHIDELVLHGFDAGSRHAIADAVQAELQQRFAASWSSMATASMAQGGAIERLAAPTVTLSSHARRDGKAIGAAIHRSVTSMHGGRS
jgi:hypothetical protein